MGWTVNVVSAVSSSELKASDFRSRVLCDDVDGVTVVRVAVPSSEGNGVGRVAGMVAYAAQAIGPGVTGKLSTPDIIMGSTVHPLAAGAGSVLAKRHRVPFVFEIRDFWPETMVKMNKLAPRSPAAVALYALERHIWQRASMITGPLAGVETYAADKGLPKRPFLHIPNGVDLDAFAVPQELPTGPTRLGYFGSHGLVNVLEVLVAAMADTAVLSLSDSLELELHLYGKGPLKPSLQEQVRRLGLTSVKFHDPVPRSSVAREMQSMDALVMPMARNGGLYRYGASPNKMQEYMAAGRPLIINAPFSPDPVQVSGCGITVPECTPSAWAAAIRQFAGTSKSVREQMGSSGRAYALKHYDFELLGRQLNRGLRPLLGQRGME